MESKKRSLAKALLWRLIGIIVLGSITWVLTKNLETTTIITLMFHTINFVLYYFHERFWERIDWGLMRKSDLTQKDKDKVNDRLRKLGYIE
jgi:uncharacterized membrane protein